MELGLQQVVSQAYSCIVYCIVLPHNSYIHCQLLVLNISIIICFLCLLLYMIVDLCLLFHVLIGLYNVYSCSLYLYHNDLFLITLCTVLVLYRGCWSVSTTHIRNKLCFIILPRVFLSRQNVLISNIGLMGIRTHKI